MTLRSRILSAAAVVLILGVLIWTARSSAQEGSGALFDGRETINVWYNDEELTDYFTQASVTYNGAQNAYRVEPHYVADVEFLETIGKASAAGRDFPDIYVITNNLLGKAALSGLAAEIRDEEHFKDTRLFPEPAQHAVTWHGKKVAYPFFYETSALLYNKSLLAQMAEQAGISVDSAEPKTILDIIRLADSFNAPEGVDAIFKWDVSDIFNNYYFVGSCIDVGGADGDDRNQVRIYTPEAIQSLQVYQQLGQFFSVDSRNDDYDSVLEDFSKGRIVFTVATTDAAAKLRKKTESGEMTFEYGVLQLPDMTDSLTTRTMSITDCLVVNGYSEHQEAANRFIQYLLLSPGELYERSGKAPATAGYPYKDEHMNGFYAAYADSVPISKMPETSNFWMFVENTLSNVWNGADAGEELRKLEQQILLQLTGSPQEVPEIETPEYVDISAQLPEGSGD
ncbi:MAG: extracellular solute-binding protein [Lachnospiraceae bacterium]|nr:extracellular solute-binding protein [Lachnospiraceae bacterium]